MERSWKVWLILVVCVSCSAVSGIALERQSDQRSTDNRLLYLPSGKYLKIASLGQSSLIADLIYLWAIQFYSDYEREDRFRYVDHIFGDVITVLDPHFVDAYWIGALILTVEAGELERGLDLLDRGIEQNPREWILPYLAGWECWHAGQPSRAAEYFEISAGVPGAPPPVRRMLAGMTSRAGELENALALWREIYEDPESDATSVAIAERKIRDLLVEIDLRDLRAAIREFRSDNTRFPRTLEELRERGYILSVPLDPDGRRYEYERRSGTVAAPGSRVLGESA